MTEPIEVTVARTEERLRGVERDVRDIKNTLQAVAARKPPWTAVLSAVAAIAALAVTLIINL